MAFRDCPATCHVGRDLVAVVFHEKVPAAQTASGAGTAIFHGKAQPLTLDLSEGDEPEVVPPEVSVLAHAEDKRSTLAQGPSPLRVDEQAQPWVWAH